MDNKPIKRKCPEKTVVIKKVKKQVKSGKTKDEESNEKSVSCKPSLIPNVIQETSDYTKGWLEVFKYLSLKDLMRVSTVNYTFNRLAAHPSVWKSVVLKDMVIHDWEEFGRILHTRDAKELDMFGYSRLKSETGLPVPWADIMKALCKAKSLEVIKLCRCSVSKIEIVVQTCTNLKVLHACYVRPGELQFRGLAALNYLQELRIRAISSVTFTIEKKVFTNSFNHLTVLSVLGIKLLDPFILRVIREMKMLEVLELGYCTSFPRDFGATSIALLSNLKRVRLEKLYQIDPEYDILKVISQHPKIKCLELVNCEICAGFDLALSACCNLEALYIIPNYMNRAEITRLVVCGVGCLYRKLKFFGYCITNELLEVTDMLLEYWKENKGYTDKFIPMNNVPILRTDEKNKSHSCVDTLPIVRLEHLLQEILPESEVLLSKIPLSETWFQKIPDKYL